MENTGAAIQVETSNCKLCGKDEVRDGRSVCDACLGFENTTETKPMKRRGRPPRSAGAGATEITDAASGNGQETEPPNAPVEPACEPIEDLRVCRKCGEEFQAYKRGCATMTSLCAECLNDRTREVNGRRKLMRTVFEDGTGDGYVLLDMRKFRAEFEALSAMAAEEIRTVDAQATYILVRSLRDSLREGVA